MPSAQVNLSKMSLPYIKNTQSQCYHFKKKDYTLLNSMLIKKSLGWSIARLAEFGMPEAYKKKEIWGRKRYRGAWGGLKRHETKYNTVGECIHAKG